jgi:hypothetical protein
MTYKKQKIQSRKRRTIPWIATGTASGAVLLAVGVQAQEQGALATFGLSFGGQYTANDPDDDESRLTTGLRFDVRSGTPQGQSFALSSDGDIQLDEDGIGFERPGLSVDYRLANQSTALSFGASYRQQDVDGEFLFFDPLDPTNVDFIEDDGTRETLRVNAGLQTGLDARFGTDTQFNYTTRRFTDTSDPDLTDLDTWQISTELSFEVDPRITLRTSASYLETDEDDAENTDRRTTRAGIGADLVIDRLWSASVNLNYSSIETERDDGLGGRIITEENGGGFSVGLDRQFRNGTLGFSLARQITANGPEDRFNVSRDREFSNGNTLTWSLGIVSFDNGDTSPIASLAYSRPTPRGNFSIDLEQTTAVDSDDRSVLRTVLGVDYDQSINNTSSWSLNGSLASIDVVGSDDDDQLRAEIGLGYNHALTADWDLSTRLSHRVTYEGGDEDSSASVLSFSIERSFSFRP